MTDDPFALASSWDPLVGATATEVVIKKFLDNFIADGMPLVGDDLKSWMVEEVEQTAAIMRMADLDASELVKRIRDGLSNPDDPLLHLLERDERSEVVWEPMDPADPEYPYLDRSQLLAAIADELEDPGTIRRRLMPTGEPS